MSGRDMPARVFGRIGLLSFGGPAARIAPRHRDLVEGRNWLTDPEFLRALSFYMLLPGPEAMQLATYAGWQRGGIARGVPAGGLFVLPGAAVILVLAAFYAAFGHLPAVTAVFPGVKARGPRDRDLGARARPAACRRARGSVCSPWRPSSSGLHRAPGSVRR